MSPQPVKHTTSISWDTDANGVKCNPRVTKDEVCIGALQFRYVCEINTDDSSHPYNISLELIDKKADDFDQHWNISIEHQEFNNLQVFNAGCRRRRFYGIAVGLRQTDDEWMLLDFDMHAVHKNFLDETLARKWGNDYRIELIEDNGVVWVNRTCLGIHSVDFRQQLEANTAKLQIDAVSTGDFLDYVYCVHPPTLKLTLARVHGIWKLAKRFKNRTVTSMCEKLLEEFQPEIPAKRRQLLIAADKLEMASVFTRALYSLNQADLKNLDMACVSQFSPQNLALVLKRVMVKHPERNVHDGASFEFLLDINKAKDFGYDCTIQIEGRHSTPIYVKKGILAAYSPYFSALFFGNFKEASSYAVTLKDVDFEQFLEYLLSVYAPSPPLTMSRVEAVLRMADRFQNELLRQHCATFLTQEVKSCKVAEKLNALYLADEFRLDELFVEAMKQLSNNEIKEIDFNSVTKFRPENVRKFLERYTEGLP